MPADTEMRRFVKGAVVEHLRQWWGDDSLWYGGLGQNASSNSAEYKAAMLRRMAGRYNVGRGIKKNQEINILETLEKSLARWPKGIVNRAEFVRCTASDILILDSNKKVDKSSPVSGLLLSGFSKMFWFMKPHCWTMFDRYARIGLGAASKPDNKSQFNAFYKKLAELDFEGSMESSRSVINGSDFPYLWPERILDKYLMLCGQSRENNGNGPITDHEHSDLLKLWSGFHDPDVERKVSKLVDGLLEVWADQALFHRHRDALGARK